MPTPLPKEKRSDFMARCIPMLVREGYKEPQATAVCYSIWGQHNIKIVERKKNV